VLPLLEERGGTPIDDIQHHTTKGGKLSTFSITTPFGDATFRFVERQGYDRLFPGLVEYAEPRGRKNEHGIEAFDHVTSNFQTMKPAALDGARARLRGIGTSSSTPTT
jgi:4-hydroxyphenylpyruvate dioxygenase